MFWLTTCTSSHPKYLLFCCSSFKVEDDHDIICWMTGYSVSGDGWRGQFGFRTLSHILMILQMHFMYLWLMPWVCYGYQVTPSSHGRESLRRTFGGVLSSALHLINGSLIWSWMTVVMRLICFTRNSMELSTRCVEWWRKVWQVFTGRYWLTVLYTVFLLAHNFPQFGIISLCFASGL